MHIVFVEKGYPRPSGSVGGAGTYVQIIARQFVKHGHAVSVICGTLESGVDTHFKDALIEVHCIIDDSKTAYYLSKTVLLTPISKLINYFIKGWKIQRQLIKINRHSRIDLVEYSEGGDFWNAVFKSFPFVSHLHGSAYTFKNNSGVPILLEDILQRKFEHFFIKRANNVVSPCIEMVKLVENEMGAKLSSFKVIAYPLDPTQIENDPETTIPKEKVNIFFASRNEVVKGGELLINALKTLRSTITSKINVHFYGYRPKQSCSNLAFLTVHPFVPKEELLEAYKTADICVIPSFFDNSPNTVYEALAAGKTVVASDAGGIPEILGFPPVGFLFKKGDTQDLASKLESAIEVVLKGDHIELGLKARDYIIKKTDLDKNVMQRIEMFKSICSC